MDKFQHSRESTQDYIFKVIRLSGNEHSDMKDLLRHTLICICLQEIKPIKHTGLNTAINFRKYNYSGHSLPLSSSVLSPLEALC